MSGGFPLLGGLVKAATAGANEAVSGGTTITASGSTNTKGSWTQLIASTAQDSVGIMVCISGRSSAGPLSYGVDIGIGAAASEVVIIQNLIAFRDDGNRVEGSSTFFFPINIPAGTRIAARCQSTSASQTVGVSAITFDGDFTRTLGGAMVDAVGFSTSTSLGTAVTPNASANTKGSYAQLTAATAVDYIGYCLAIDMQNTAGNTPNCFFDLAIGGSGSETIILPDYYTICFGGFLSGGPNPIVSPFIPCFIPSGTRLAARFQTDGASGNALGVTFYGVR